MQSHRILFTLLIVVSFASFSANEKRANVPLYQNEVTKIERFEAEMAQLAKKSDQTNQKDVGKLAVNNTKPAVETNKREDITLYQNEDYTETEHSAAEVAKLAKEGDQTNLKDVDELAKDDDLGQKQKKPFRLEFEDSVYDVSNRIRVDGFYGVNLRFANDRNNDCDPQLDKTAFPGRHTMDTWFLYTYGSKSRGYDVVKFRSGVRNRAVWGDELNILPTSSTSIKHVDAIIGDHTHAITRHVIWFREIWLEMVLNDIFGCESKKRHTVTMGLFPFSLGRGIALGDAFEVDPDFLGYFATNAIDQFAPAFKLSGELIAPLQLTYDLYAEIADNSSNTFDQVNEENRSQRFDTPGQRHGSLFRPQRGFGIFDYILAARLQWRPYDKPGKKVHFEPYALYSVDREQRIEFPGDAKQKLGTFGLAGEFEWGNFEGGFDTAFNVGRQDVFGWDRNIVEEANKQGTDKYVYTKVVTEKPRIGKPGPVAEKTPETARIVDNSIRDQAQNGKIIGVIDHPDGKTTELFNALNRFTNPYHNTFHGAMFVFDMAYNFPHNIKLAATAGFATGDNDPNKDVQSHGESNVHTKFKGFVGEQEIYSGKRVRSLLVMSGPLRLPRLISIPALDVVDGKFSATTRFTNLILSGAGMEFKPKVGRIPLVIKPNALAFWAWHTPTIFRVDGRREGETDLGDDFGVTFRRKHVRNFLGVELNFTLEAELLKDLTYIFNIAGFFPGAFFDDVKGTPLNKAERDFLAAQAEPNQDAPVKRVPTMGNDTAYYVQMTIEYKF